MDIWIAYIRTEGARWRARGYVWISRLCKRSDLKLYREDFKTIPQKDEVGRNVCLYLCVSEQIRISDSAQHSVIQ